MTPDSWNVWLPFTFSLPVDPTAVETVGDQVLVEHVFGFHQINHVKNGFLPYFSDVKIDANANRISFSPRFPIRRADGTTYSFDDYSGTLQLSFSGTRHGRLEDLQARTACASGSVEVTLKTIPVDLSTLMTWPDFAFYDVKNRLITGKNDLRTTGPYYVDHAEECSARLHLNPYFPDDLRANQVPVVHLRSYRLQKKQISSFDAKQDPLIYLLGSSLGPSDIVDLKTRGYATEVFPSEWFAYFIFSPKAASAKKTVFESFLSSHKSQLREVAPFARDAYSVAPAEGPVGLSAPLSRPEAAGDPKDKASTIRLAIYQGFLEEMPFLRRFKEELEKHPDRFQVVVTDEKNTASKLVVEDRADVIFRFLGISPENPVGHISYLLDSMPEIFGGVVSKQELGHALTLDLEEFVPVVRDIEERLVRSGRVIPLFHFPGVVAHASYLERDENLAWNWGIQAWTYRVR